MVERIGVSLDSALLSRFDSLVEDLGYSNRSEAIRDLIREALIKREWEAGSREAMGVALIVYNHKVLDLARRLAAHQHEHYATVVATLHVHLDRHNCLEVVVLRGKMKKLKELASRLISAKGVKHGHFIPTTTGKSLA